MLAAGAWLAIAPTAACELPASLDSESVVVASVYDGDSLRLSDGRRVRLVGVNAPELTRPDQEGQPLARAARQRLRELADGRRLTLVYDREREDHYGRTLAYLFDADDRSLEAELLREGLSFHIAIPPNTYLADCLKDAERQAREAGRGVWGHEGWRARPAAELSPDNAGFQRVVGTVTDISQAGGSVWLELDGPLVLRVAVPVWSALRKAGLEKGVRVEVRGWIIDRSDSSAARRGFKPLVLRVRSTYDLRVLRGAGRGAAQGR